MHFLPLWVAILIGSGTFVAAVSISIGLLYSQDSAKHEFVHDKVNDAAVQWSATVTAEIESAEASASGVQGFALGNSNISETLNHNGNSSERVRLISGFEMYADSTLKSSGAVVALQIHSSGIVTQSYSKNGTFSTGQDFFNDTQVGPSTRKSAETNRNSNGIVRDTNGVFLMARVPLYNLNLSTSVSPMGRWWGMAAAIVDLNATLSKSSLAAEMLKEGLNWCIKCGAGSEGLLAAGYNCDNRSLGRGHFTALPGFDSYCPLGVVLSYVDYEHLLSKENVAYVVAFSCIGAMFVVFLSEVIFIRYSTKWDDSKYAPKTTPFVFIIVSLHNGDKLWSSAPDCAMAILNQFAEITRVAAQNNSIYETIRIAPHIFCFVSRYSDDAVRFGVDIIANGDAVDYPEEAAKALQVSTMAICVMAHRCDDGIITFDADQKRYQYNGGSIVTFGSHFRAAWPCHVLLTANAAASAKLRMQGLLTRDGPSKDDMIFFSILYPERTDYTTAQGKFAEALRRTIEQPPQPAAQPKRMSITDTGFNEIGVTGTSSPLDISRFIPIPENAVKILERLYLLYAQSVPGISVLPFEKVKVKLFLFSKAFEILFNAFSKSERQNVFVRLNNTFGVPLDDTIVFHLAAKCALILSSA